MKKTLLSIIFVCVAVLMSSCRYDIADNIMVGRRTIICYMAIENSLYNTAKSDVEEMLSYAKQMNDSDRLIVYMDDNELPKIYLIDNKITESAFRDLDPIYNYPSEENSCSEDAMSAFFKYVTTYFPASSYGLILCSHGNAWYPSRLSADNKNVSESRSRKAFGIDNGYNSAKNEGHELNIIDMSKAIHSLPHLDFIFFDLCYMQCIEIAYELRDCTDYIIGSPAEIPGNGAPYNLVMDDMFATTFNPSKLIDEYSKSYDGWCGRQSGIAISAIDCRQLDNFYDVTRRMIAKNVDKMNMASNGNVTNYLDYYERKWKYQMGLYDIQDLMRNVTSESDYKEWEKSLSLAVPYKYVAPLVYSQMYYATGTSMYVYTSPETCCGVSMSLDPSDYTDNSDVISSYRVLQWKYR